MRMIERTSPVPYYEQLYNILRERIRSGGYGIGERLPSEHELCREYGLSRATVRQTLSKLESDGFAHRIARRGVFASQPSEPSGWTVEEGFLESQIRHGQTGIETMVVGQRTVVAPAHVSEALEIGPSAEVLALDRVRSLHGVVAMFSTNWFPADVGRIVVAAQGVMNGSESLNALLRNAGFSAHGAHRVMRAVSLDQEVSDHLGVAAGSPVLQVRSATWDKDGRRFDYYQTWVLTEIIPLEVNVSASRA
ncbi:MAG: GntR family transcriptional regulator [Propioniciclava sp.]